MGHFLWLWAGQATPGPGVKPCMMGGMPEPTTLFVFCLATLALIAIPGPNVLYIMARGVELGRRGGIASALGVETGSLVHIAAAAAGLSAVLASSAVAFDAVRYLGAAYLIYLGVRTLVGEGAADAPGPQPEHRLARIYLQGVIVNVLNPKVALFFLAFLPRFVDPAAGPLAAQVLVLGVIFFFIGLAVDLLYALGAGSLGGWLKQRPGFLRRQRYVTGSVYLALGATAALAGRGRSGS